MFNNNKKLEKEIERLHESIALNNRLHEQEVSRLKEVKQYDVDRLKVEHKDAIARLTANQDYVIEKELQSVKTENNTLQIRTQTQAKEIEMYTKAFENLGFDVKDMKDILNKLVDGLIAKNEIKLVK